MTRTVCFCFVLFCFVLSCFVLFVLFLLGDKSLKGVLGGVLLLEHRAEYEQVECCS